MHGSSISINRAIPYLVFAGALALVWHASRLRLEAYGYSQEDISQGLTFYLLRWALPAIIAAIALSAFYKRVSALPRLAFFLILLVGAILYSRFPCQLPAAVIVYLTIKNRALFFHSAADTNG